MDSELKFRKFYKNFLYDSNNRILNLYVNSEMKYKANLLREFSRFRGKQVERVDIFCSRLSSTARLTL